MSHDQRCSGDCGPCGGMGSFEGMSCLTCCGSGTCQGCGFDEGYDKGKREAEAEWSATVKRIEAERNEERAAAYQARRERDLYADALPEARLERDWLRAEASRLRGLLRDVRMEVREAERYPDYAGAALDEILSITDKVGPPSPTSGPSSAGSSSG